MGMTTDAVTDSTDGRANSTDVQAARDDSPPTLTGLRARVARLIESNWFQSAIMVVILVNAVALGLETSGTVMGVAGPALLLIDKLALAIFVVEIGLKLFAYRLRFFRTAWNVFDFIIVALTVLPFLGQSVSALRALRVLRAFRLMSMVPKMRVVVQALVAAIPGMSSILALLSLVFYVFAVMATKLFGATFPDWFGTIGASLYTLFQVMTLESWSMGIVRPVMEVHPWAWIYFIPFILIATFAVLNLFIAVVVDAMQEMHRAETQGLEAEMAADHAALLTEVRALRTEIAALRAERGGQS